MYKLSFTVQKNPTKLFENGLIRFSEVNGLYVPLRFIVEQEKKEFGKKKKVEVVNPAIQDVKFYLRGPERISKDGSSASCRDVRAIAEFQGSGLGDDYDAYRAFNRVVLDAGFEDQRGYSSCLTHFRVDVVEHDGASIFDKPLVQSLELVVGNPETIEHMLKTMPGGGGRYATPMHACLIDVAIAGNDVSHVNQAADKIYAYFEKLQNER